MCVCLFVKTLLPELKIAASSTLDSVHNNTQGGLYPYRASKVGWLETLYCVIYTINASKKSFNYYITISSEILLLILLMHSRKS